MPEGDTIFRAARALNKVMARRVVRKFETVLPKLSRVDVDSELVGRTIEQVKAQGKWMLMFFSGDLILLTHMLMSGSWHIYRPGEAWQRGKIHMRIVIASNEFVAVAFNVPIAEFHSAASLQRRLSQLGPSVLAEKFDEARILKNFRAEADSEVGPALLNQGVLAGVGNVFKSEICFACGVNPFRRVDSLTIQELGCLVTTARRFIQANVAEASGGSLTTYRGLRRTTFGRNLEDRLWVYRRNGKPCHRCGAAIVARRQNPGARTTFFCWECQPMVHPAGKKCMEAGE
jgi:endonuclease-8